MNSEESVRTGELVSFGLAVVLAVPGAVYLILHAAIAASVLHDSAYRTAVSQSFVLSLFVTYTTLATVAPLAMLWVVGRRFSLKAVASLFFVAAAAGLFLFPVGRSLG